MNEIKNNKMENSYLGRSWYFVTFSVADYPPPPLWKIQISNFFPKSKFEVADYPPPGKSKFPTFSLSPNSKLQITPPSLENSYLGRSWYFVIFQLQITPPLFGKSKFPTFSLSRNPKLQITPPLSLWKIQISNFFPKSKFEVADYPPPLWKIHI